LLVGNMDEAGLRDAIEGPARVAGLTLEQGLADLILRDVAGEPGGLPLLSHALLEVWKRRDGRMLTIAGYGASGGVSGAIACTADAVYESFNADEQRVVRSVFLRLTELGDGTEDTRRRATLEELASESAAGTERTEVVLDTLVAARLVTVSEGTIEVAHEALIREWPRLRAWLDEDREGLRVMRHLTHAARDWAERGCDDSELYRGPRLAAALEWRASGHQEDLNPLEHEFLDAGQREIEARASAQQRATRRMRGLLAGVGIALVLALIAGALALNQRNRANSARDRFAAAAEAEAVRRLAVQSRVAQDTSLDLSLLLAVEANRRDDSRETRGTLQSALLSNPQLLGFLRGTASAYKSIAIDRAGVVAAGSGEGTVDLWSGDRRLTGTLAVGVSGFVTVVFAGNGSLLGVLSEADHSLSLWDVTTMARVGEPFTTDAAIGSSATFAFSPDGRDLSAALQSGEIATWDVATRVETGARLRSGDSSPRGAFRAVAYSPDSRLLATGIASGGMALYDMQSRAPAAVSLSPGPTTPPASMAFNPQGSLLVAGTDAAPTFMWDLTTGQLVASPLLLSTTNGQVAFSPDGMRFALGSGFETLELVDPARPDEPLASVHTQGGVQQGVAYSPDGRYVAVANGDGSVAIVDVVGERKLGHPLPTAPLQYGIFSPDGSMLAAPDYADGSLSLLDPESGRVIRRLEPPGMRPISALLIPEPAFSPDGRFVAYGGLTGRVAIFDVTSGDVVKTLTPPPATTAHPFIDPAIAPVYVGQLAFSPDGTKLVSSALETATLFDVATGQQLAQLTGWDTLATNAFFTPDGKYVVISGFYSVTLLFDPTTGEQVGDPVGDSTAPAYLANNGLPDTLVTSDFSGNIRLVDLRTRTQVGPPMTGKAVPVSIVVVLPGGDRIVAAFFGGPTSEAWIFERATGQAIGDPFPSLAQFSAASVSPDGKTLITGDGTQMMRWDIDWTTWRQTACRIAGRNLTQAEWSLYLPNGGPYRPTCPEFPG
jgi:WD40 repeat protein